MISYMLPAIQTESEVLHQAAEAKPRFKDAGARISDVAWLTGPGKDLFVKVSDKAGLDISEKAAHVTNTSYSADHGVLVPVGRVFEWAKSIGVDTAHIDALKGQMQARGGEKRKSGFSLGV